MSERMSGTGRRTTRWLAVAGVLVAALAVDPPPASAQGAGQVSLPLGTPAPAAELEDLDGNPVQLLDYVRGKPAVLEFWATWCENCEALQPQMDRIQAEHGDELAVVAVAVAVNQNVRRIRRHLEGHDPGYPYLYDGGGNAVRAYAATTTSVVVMLDAQGNVAYTGVGRDQDLVGAVEALLAPSS